MFVLDGVLEIAGFNPCPANVCFHDAFAGGQPQATMPEGAFYGQEATMPEGAFYGQEGLPLQDRVP
jgi:hypothetical protein